MGATSAQESAAGWTDEFVVTWDSFSIANIGVVADDTAYTFTYNVPAGSWVSDVGANLVTAFDDSGGGAQLNVIVGDDADDNGYLTTAALHTDQSEITTIINTGALVVGGSGARGKAYTTDDTIDLIFSIAGAAYTVNELNAGKVVFRFTMLTV